MLSLDDITKRQNIVTECIYYFNMGVSIERISSLANVSRPSVYKIIKSNLNYVTWSSRRTKDNFASSLDKSLSIDNKDNDNSNEVKKREERIKKLERLMGESGEHDE